MCENVTQPPLGLRPRHIHTKRRISEIRTAIERYLAAGYAIPVEWITEYNELVEKIPIEEKEFLESLKNSNHYPLNMQENYGKQTTTTSPNVRYD